MSLRQMRPLRIARQFGRHAGRHNATVRDDRHALAKIGNVFDDMRREDHHDVLAHFRKQIEEAVAFLRIEPGRRFVDDEKCRTPYQRLCDAETLAHATGKSRNRLLAHCPQIGLLEKSLHRIASFAGSRDAFEHRHMIEHRISRDARINAEILRQITQNAAKFLGLCNDVDVAKPDIAAGRCLQRCNAAHESRFAGAVRSQQAEHAAGNFQAHLVDSADAAAIDMCKILDLQHVSPSLCGPRQECGREGRFAMGCGAQFGVMLQQNRLKIATPG